MKQSTINKRQYIILSFYLTRVLFLGIGFSVMVGIGRNTLLIASFLGMMLGYFILYLFSKKRRVSRISNVLLSVTTLTAGLLASTTLTGTYLLYNTPTLFIMGFFFLVLIYGSTKEIKITARIGELFFPISGVFIIFSLLALTSLISLYNLLPIFNTSFADFFKCIIVFTSTSLMPNLLLLNYKGDLKFKDIGKGYLLGAILTIIVMFFILSIYGSEFASIIRYPEYLMLSKINIFNFISNVENILVMEWIVNLTIGGLICLRVLVDNLNIYMVATIIVLIILGVEFLMIRNYVNVLIFKKSIYFICACIIVLSLMLKPKNHN